MKSILLINFSLSFTIHQMERHEGYAESWEMVVTLRAKEKSGGELRETGGLYYIGFAVGDICTRACII